MPRSLTVIRFIAVEVRIQLRASAAFFIGSRYRVSGLGFRGSGEENKVIHQFSFPETRYPSPETRIPNALGLFHFPDHPMMET